MVGSVLCLGFEHHPMLQRLQRCGLVLTAGTEAAPQDEPTAAVVLVRTGSALDVGRVRRCARRWPTTAVMGIHDAQLAIALLSAGATAVVDGGCDERELAHAIRLAVSGVSVLPRALVAGLVEAAVRQPLRSHGAGAGQASLSEADVALVRALTTGKSTSRLARDFHVSERTMYRRLANLYRRLGAESRAQAIARAAHLGLCDQELSLTGS